MDRKPQERQRVQRVLFDCCKGVAMELQRLDDITRAFVQSEDVKKETDNG